MLPSAMLEGKNDLIHAVENIEHVRVCVCVRFVFWWAPDRNKVGHVRVRVHFVFDAPDKTKLAQAYRL
jgi:hypothetical protein